MKLIKSPKLEKFLTASLRESIWFTDLWFALLILAIIASIGAAAIYQIGANGIESVLGTIPNGVSFERAWGELWATIYMGITVVVVIAYIIRRAEKRWDDDEQDERHQSLDALRGEVNTLIEKIDELKLHL